MQPCWAEETRVFMTGSVRVTWLMAFSSVSSLSLTFSCDGHHLYTANSEGTVIAWCRRDQQRLKLPMFYSFLSSYAAGWPHQTDAESDPADPGRGGASMHKAPPPESKILYHKEQGLVRLSPHHSSSSVLTDSCICVVWFWKLLQSGPPRPNV